MERYLSFPSKTFLVGEYAVLKGAPAVIVNTNPRFYFFVSSKDPHKSIPVGQNHLQTSKIHYAEFHPNSPAGHWLAQHPHIQNYRFASWDPHSGWGGFGSSSAQFNLVYYLEKYVTQKILDHSVKKHFAQEITWDTQSVLSLWQAYRHLSFEGQRASGADVVSQWVGQVCLFSSQPFHVRSIPWPFPDLDFILLRTGVTVKTWEHLQSLTIASLQTTQLSRLASQAITHMENADSTGFTTVLSEYAIYLQKLNLVHEHVLDLLQQIQSPLVMAAKGCGALGAEVICVLFHPNNKQAILQRLKDKHIVATAGDLTDGICQHLKTTLPKNVKFQT